LIRVRVCGGGSVVRVVLDEGGTGIVAGMGFVSPGRSVGIRGVTGGFIGGVGRIFLIVGRTHGERGKGGRGDHDPLPEPVEVEDVDADLDSPEDPPEEDEDEDDESEGLSALAAFL
jgi:hypothetical protein